MQIQIHTVQHRSMFLESAREMSRRRMAVALRNYS
jgi:hypothetical protein